LRVVNELSPIENERTGKFMRNFHALDVSRKVDNGSYRRSVTSVGLLGASVLLSLLNCICQSTHGSRSKELNCGNM